MRRVTWCHCVLNVSICCSDQTPSWLPSSPKGEIVGNMMQSVILDGNPLDRVLSLNGNPLDEDDDNLLDEVMLDRICLDKLVR